jgi:ribosomal protein S18 acetylase RimI-like enzyme
MIVFDPPDSVVLRGSPTAHSSPDESVLDNPVWSGLTGPHAPFARTFGRVRGYPDTVSPFAACASDAGADPSIWDDFVGLVGPDAVIGLVGLTLPDPPPSFRLEWRGDAVQFVDTGVRAESDPRARPLASADVPEMLDLVRRTRPGPFHARTIELAGYLGIHHDGRLVAMAGRRMHPTGWVEVSAVCTDPEFRGQGLASALIRAVTAGIRADGDRAFLHTTASNSDAIRLYEALGFELRRRITINIWSTPPASDAASI